MKNYVVIGIVALVVVVSMVQAFQISKLKNEMTGNVVSTGSNQNGESYEEMMARMHPDQAKKTTPASQPTTPTMVGGC